MDSMRSQTFEFITESTISFTLDELETTIKNYDRRILIFSALSNQYLNTFPT